MKTFFVIVIAMLIVILSVKYSVFNKNPETVSSQYKDLVKLEFPKPNGVINSPVTIKGEARGNWFFEASFPVVLTDWDGLIIAQGIAQAKGEWMTTEYVPFEAELTFAVPTYKDNGILILQKDNPSGLPENDDAFEIPIKFK